MSYCMYIFALFVKGGSNFYNVCYEVALDVNKFIAWTIPCLLVFFWCVFFKCFIVVICVRWEGEFENYRLLALAIQLGLDSESALEILSS